MLKYPLMLHGLLEVTPTDHPDYTALVWAEKEARNVADRINELKKRKDIVEKIVRKRNDSDIRHGISKLITRRTEILRQTMGTSEAVVDPLYNKLVESFNMHCVQLQIVFRDIDEYVLRTNQFFEQFLQIPASFTEFVDMSQTPYPEVEAKWRRFDAALKDMVKVALTEHVRLSGFISQCEPTNPVSGSPGQKTLCRSNSGVDPTLRKSTKAHGEAE